MARFTIFIPDELAARLEAARPEDVPRSKFIRRALEKALDGTVLPAVDVPRLDPGDVSPPASSRAPSKLRTREVEDKPELDHLKSSGLLQPAKYVKRFNPQPKK